MRAAARVSGSGGSGPSQVVLATGAIERPLVFCNNDRPGVMLASGVSEYIHRYGVLPGSRVVVFTNNDSAYRTAFDLLDAGAKVPKPSWMHGRPAIGAPRRENGAWRSLTGTPSSTSGGRRGFGECSS